MFEGFPDPVIRYETDGDALAVVDGNDAFDRVFDGDAARPPALDDELAGAVADGSRIDETVSVGEDGRPFRVRSVPEAREGNHERPGRGGWLVYTDVSALSALEARNERLDEFAHTVAHDLRNPLDVAKMRLDAARETGDDVHFEKVAAAHDRMERIIADVLELAKQGHVIGAVEPVAVRSVAEDAWASTETGDATLVVADDRRTLPADPDRLQELFENLFGNAVRYGGDDVTVTVTVDETGLAVADDGEGIPPGRRDRVWESGYTTSERGTGFGLAIVRRIAEAHDWSVSLTASEAGGARFHFGTDGVV